MHKRLTIALLLTAFAAIIVPAASAQTFYWSDSTGDAPGGAPDLTTTSASIDTNGLITWTIVTQTLRAFDSQTAVDVRINSDASMATGYKGIDYLIRTADGIVGFYRWNGASFELADAPGLGATLAFPMTVTVQSSAIGSPSTVWFQLRAWGRSPYVETCCADDAPETAYWWGFTTTTPNTAPSGGSSLAPSPTPVASPNPTSAPPAAPVPGPSPVSSSVPTSPSLSSSPSLADFDQPELKKAPSLPREPKRRLQLRSTRIAQRGASLTITARFTSTVAKAKVRCNISQGGKHLPPIVGRVSGSAATCRATAGGNGKIAGTMTLKVGGTTTRVPISLSV